MPILRPPPRPRASRRAALRRLGGVDVEQRDAVVRNCFLSEAIFGGTSRNLSTNHQPRRGTAIQAWAIPMYLILTTSPHRGSLLAYGHRHQTLESIGVDVGPLLGRDVGRHPVHDPPLPAPMGPHLRGHHDERVDLHAIDAMCF